MTSPDLIRELRESRPAAPTELRARVREVAREESVPVPVWSRFRLRARRGALVALPAAAALALVSAGAIGLSRSDGSGEIAALESNEQLVLQGGTMDSARSSGDEGAEALKALADAQSASIGPTSGRAQRVTATLAVEVRSSDAVSRASQDALDLTRRLGGHVLSASVTTGEEPSAALTVRVPVGRVQEAVVQLSALGRIVSQKVTIDDLQGTLDRLDRRERSVQAQIAILVARLDSDSLDATTRARLEARLTNLRGELRDLRRGLSRTNAEARMATLQLAVVTPNAGAVAPSSRLDRALGEALNVLVWEGVILLAILIVAAPFALVAVAAWLGRRLYRRREEDRLLAT